MGVPSRVCDHGRTLWHIHYIKYGILSIEKPITSCPRPIPYKLSGQ